MRVHPSNFVQMFLAVLVGLLSLDVPAATFEVQLPANLREGP